MSTTKVIRKAEAAKVISTKLNAVKRKDKATGVIKLARMSDDGAFQAAIHGVKLPKRPDHNYLKKRFRLTPNSTNYSWGETITFQLNNSPIDFTSKLVLEINMEAVATATTAYWPYISEIFTKVVLELAGQKVSEIKKTALMKWFLAHDSYEDYLRHTFMHEGETVPGTRVNAVGNAQTFYLDFTPFYCNRQELPVSKLIMGAKKPELQLTLDSIGQSIYSVDGAGAAIAPTFASGSGIESMVLHQEGYEDTDRVQITPMLTMLAGGTEIPYVLKRFDTERQTVISTTDEKFTINTGRKLLVEELLVFLLDVNSNSAYLYNPIDDANALTDFYIEYKGSRMYPNTNSVETMNENLIVKRDSAYANGKNIVRISFGDDLLRKMQDTELPDAVINNTIDMRESGDTIIHINGAVIGDTLVVTTVSKDLFTITGVGHVIANYS